MYNSLLEITKDLQETFDNSADLTVRTLILQAPERRKAAVITLEGMVRTALAPKRLPRWWIPFYTRCSRRLM